MIINNKSNLWIVTKDGIDCTSLARLADKFKATIPLNPETLTLATNEQEAKSEQIRLSEASQLASFVMDCTPDQITALREKLAEMRSTARERAIAP